MASALSTHIIDVEIPLVSEQGTEVGVSRARWSVELGGTWSGQSLDLPFVIRRGRREYRDVARLGDPSGLAARSTYRHPAITVAPLRIEEIDATGKTPGTVATLVKRVY